MTEDARHRTTNLRTMTPLLVIASFVTLTEIVAGLAASKATGNVQLIFTLFAVLFPATVASAFFAVLWHRPYVLYGPTEFGKETDVGSFVGAMRPHIVRSLGGPIQPPTSESDTVNEIVAASLPQDTQTAQPELSDDWFPLFQRKEYVAAAKAVVDTASDTKLDIGLAHAIAGSILLEKSRAEGLAYYEKTFSTLPKLAEPYQWLANSYTHTKETDSALAVLDRGIAAGADLHSLIITRSRIMADAGQGREAVDLLQRHDPQGTSSLVAFTMGQILEGEGLQAEAIDAYEAALAVDPKFESALLRVAQLKAGALESAAALILYKRLLSIDPKSATYHTLLGNLYLELNLHGKALNAYETANEIAEGKEGWILANIGNILNNRGFGIKAVSYLERAVAIDPKSSYAVERLATAMKSIEVENQAEAALLREHTAAPNSTQSVLLSNK